MAAAVLAHDQFFNWSINQLAQEFGIDRSTVVRRLRAADVSPSGERRSFPVYSVRQAAEAILVPPTSSGAALHDPANMVPKERADWYKSENDRIKFEKEIGVLTSVEACREQMGEIAKMGLQILETLPDMLERDYQLEPEIIELVERKVDSLRLTWAEALEG